MSRARQNFHERSEEAYALFAGGRITTQPTFSNVVDIFDLLSGMWNTSTLSASRELVAAASLGNLAFFGGGYNSTSVNIVDIFNATTQTWSTATLSQARHYLAAASIGDIVAFGGGSNGSVPVSVVDVYNVTSNMWFTLSLDQSRGFLAATSSTNTIFFGGGATSSGDSDFVDIFSLPNTPPPSPQVQTLSSTPTPTTAYSFPASIQIPMSMSMSINSPFLLPRPSVEPIASFSGVVVGIVVGIVALLIAVGLILFLTLFIKKRRKRKIQIKRSHNENNEMIEEKSGAVVTESNMNTVVFEHETNTTTPMTTTLSTYQPGTETLKSLSPGQIPLNELEIDREIGQGTYGRVCVGKWKKYRVALKFCQNRGKMNEFLREANLMISLSPHPNVVRIYGVSIDGTQPIIVMEYCAGGSLDKLLYDNEQQISLEVKLRWVYEIAVGMSHLHKFNIVHRDLAARNILLSHSNPNNAQLKISDFGMSRVLQEDIEGKTKNTFGPIRWMAPESIRSQVYSKQSDVWMFGMLVYEIVAQCEPHVDVDPNEVAILIRDKVLTPEIPSDCPEKLRQVMQLCWQQDPKQRPTMESIRSLLENVD
jgi:hypothetical protein